MADVSFRRPCQRHGQTAPFGPTLDHPGRARSPAVETHHATVPLTPLCPSFRAAPGPGLLFLSDQHRQIVDAVLGSQDEDRPLLILSAPPGTGKTVLAQHLAQSCRDRRAVLLGTSRAELLDLPHHLIVALSGHDGGPVLLVVDEAQGLPDAALDHIAQWVGTPGHRALLLGGTDLQARLAAPRHDMLRARIGGRFHLSPLDQAGTAAYVTHRFRVPGCACHAGLQVFDADGIAQLHRLSGGVPRIINHLVQACLFEARPTGRTSLDAGFVRDCLSLLLRDGRLSHLRGGTAPPPATPAPDRPAPVVAPAPAPSAALRRRAHVARHGPRLAATALLAGLLILAPVQPTDTGQMPPALAHSPLSARVKPQAPPIPERLLAEALTLGQADPDRAAQLYARAALWGNERAAYYLGQLHEIGDGVTADPLRAKGWYQAAPGIAGATDSLARITSTAATSFPTAPARPTLQIPLLSGQTELHWQAPAGVAGFRVQFIEAGGKGQNGQVDTALTAALIDRPVQAWRIITLDRDGTPGAASAWSRLDPGPR